MLLDVGHSQHLFALGEGDLPLRAQNQPLPQNQADILRHLAVRDYLISRPAEAAASIQLKSELAQKFPNDIQTYSTGKDEFVKALERKHSNGWRT